MLTKRIIPCLDVKAGRVVKGVQFQNLADVGDPPALAERYEQEGADEIVFLDITATIEARKTMHDIARRTAERLRVRPRHHEDVVRAGILGDHGDQLGGLAPSGVEGLHRISSPFPRSNSFTALTVVVP